MLSRAYRHTFVLRAASLVCSQISVDSGMSSCPSTPPTPTSPVELDIRLTSESDRSQIRDLLCNFFFRDEPLNNYSNLIQPGEPLSLELEQFSMGDLDDGVSLVALHEGKLIGVTLNKLLQRNAAEQHIEVRCEKFRKIVNLLAHVERESDIFKKYPGIDKGMFVNILSVDTTYRGKGIAKTLMEKTRELAIEKGCGFMSVDCTSHFTALALKKLGFELHYSLNYCDYKVDGKVVFKPAAPHTAVTVYTQKL